MFPTKWLASSVEHDRRVAGDLFTTTRCDVQAPANELGTDLTSVWRRALRYRAERETTAKRFSRDVATAPCRWCCRSSRSGCATRWC